MKVVSSNASTSWEVAFSNTINPFDSTLTSSLSETNFILPDTTNKVSGPSTQRGAKYSFKIFLLLLHGTDFPQV